MKKKKRKKPITHEKEILLNIIISLVCGLITTIIGAIFSFWLTKTYGFSIFGGIYG